MLEKTLSLNFFLKADREKSNLRGLYLRITVDGNRKEFSLNQKWDIKRWNQKAGRANGVKEDAKTLNYLLDTIISRITKYKLELLSKNVPITASLLMDYAQGKGTDRSRVLEEFQKHNDEMFKLVPKEYAIGTHERYVTARSHVGEFIKNVYNKDDIEFRELNHEFIIGYEHYLKTVRACSNNTAIKYISNFKKIVLRALAKGIISSNPFLQYKPKKTKLNKRPLSKTELAILENKEFNSERLSIVRDVFVFQCYTGLAYIDVFQLKKSDITKDEEGNFWIRTNRQKTDANITIPLLPKAVEIMEKYDNHPDCTGKDIVLPVRSNQKMNEYLNEIASICEISDLNTHKARRTFGSTVTLANGVPIHVVKEMLGHHSVKQTEEYALTEEEAIKNEMQILKGKLEKKPSNDSDKYSGLIDGLRTLDLNQDKINQLTNFIMKLV
ncbi:site-specific integrase [Myroides sp. M-43]|uniref:site-specific integrase n=1 Tax=Myroides oncorhynchi TaxID=2893756 RepID=UPI001E5357C8|nr:site-specific integrase [Myroides oncorhynchi]MCC9043312.1 site-specific integrase [Myroides oncorhynchi]